jgi:AraC-like DNA-binding protein
MINVFHIARNVMLSYKIACIILLFFLSVIPAVARNVIRQIADTDSVKYSITYYDDRIGVELWHVTKIIEDAKGMIWFGSWNGLIRYDGYDFTSFKTKPGDGNDVRTDRIRNIISDTDVLKGSKSACGNIYCRMDDNLFLFDTTSGLFSPVADNIKQQVQSAMHDDEKKYIRKYDLQCNDTVIRGITVDLQDSYGNIWVKNANGLYRISKHNTPWRKIDGLPDDVVRMMYKERDGTIWIALRDARSIARLSPDLRLEGFLGADGRIHKAPVNFVSAYSMLEDRKGNLWIGTKPDGLYRLRKRHSVAGAIEYDVEHIVPANMPQVGELSIYDIQEDQKGRIWLGTFGNSLCMIANPDAAKERIAVINVGEKNSAYPTEAAKVRRINIMKDGTLLAVTTTGLAVSENIYKEGAVGGKWTYHTREANRNASLTTSATTDIVFMNNGMAAVSTESGGIGLINNEELRNDKLELQHVTTANGLISDIVQALYVIDDTQLLLQQNDHLTIMDVRNKELLTFLPAFWGATLRFADARPILVKEKRLLLSLENGAVVVPLSALKKPADSPQIALTEVSIAGLPADYCSGFSDTILLSSSQRSLSMKYATLDYRNSKNIWYVTRMDGERWSKPTLNREITFYNLDPGEHLLEIRSTNAMGQWTQNTKKLTIIVEPKFFETWYGQFLLYLLIAAVITGVVYTYFYIRTIKRQRRDTLAAYLMLVEEKERAQIIHEKNMSEAAETVAEQPVRNAEQPAVAPQPTVEVLSPHMSQEDRAFMQRLVNFVNENMSNSGISVQDMAEATAMSRSSLNRKMHTLLGVTPADFLREARMKRACELLRTSGQSTSDIAYACGFSDPKYFSKTFKMSQGMSPRSFREQTKG